MSFVVPARRLVSAIALGLGFCSVLGPRLCLVLGRSRFRGASVVPFSCSCPRVRSRAHSYPRGAASSWLAAVRARRRVRVRVPAIRT